MKQYALLSGKYKTLSCIHTVGNKPSETAVIILNSGLIHHSGPSRVGTKLAMKLAEKNISSIRYDASGIGNSLVRIDNISIYDIALHEPIEVMNDFAKRGYKHFILIGICAGSYSSFHCAAQDPRIIGSIVVNPENLAESIDGIENQALETAQENRYWKSSIFRAQAWINLFTGAVNYNRLFTTLRRQFFRIITLQTLRGKRGAELPKILKATLEGIYTNKTKVIFITADTDKNKLYVESLMQSINSEFSGDKDLSGRVEHHIVKNSDHLFSHVFNQKDYLDFTTSWISGLVSSTKN